MLSMSLPATTLALIGSQIRAARTERSLSATALAERAGLHRNTLHALESGRGNIELNSLLSILKQLDLTIAVMPTGIHPDLLFNESTEPTALQARLAALRDKPPARRRSQTPDSR